TANINLPGVNAAGNQSTSGNAATATKLVTPRAINGTNFDGSAAITTANWGTARTLTIGNSGKSVNGGGNVAWSLAEIGAAPEGHGLGTYAGGVSNTTTDLRTKSGFYNASGATGAPVGGHTWKYYFNAAHANAAGYNGTIAMDFDGGVLAFRAISGGADRGWKYVYHSGNKPSAADVGLGSVNNTADSAKNVLSATKLTTPRTIGGVSFDGTANINLPGVNTAGNQNTSGNAATATKLATARTINGVSFDGTASITVADSTKVPTSRTVNDKALTNDIVLSAADVGALPITGGTVNGDLTVDGNLHSKGNVLVNTANVITVYTSMVNFGDSSYSRGCRIYAKGGNLSIYAAAGASYKVYHEGFKPTAFDIQVTDPRTKQEETLMEVIASLTARIEELEAKLK
ncbi:MAG: hypothetical protein ACRC9H_18830, partial [Aeromonas veronii]